MKGENRYWSVMTFAFILPMIFAALDIYGAKMWESLGGWEAAAYTTAEPLYQGLFWTFAYVLVFAVAITYYLVRKDKSEALALLLIPYILLQFGVEDVIFYWLRGLDVFGATMPWLVGNLIPPTILANVFNGGVINGYVLFISAVLGITIAIVTAQYLLKKKW